MERKDVEDAIKEVITSVGFRDRIDLLTDKENVFEILDLRRWNDDNEDLINFRELNLPDEYDMSHHPDWVVVYKHHSSSTPSIFRIWREDSPSCIEYKIRTWVKHWVK